MARQHWNYGSGKGTLCLRKASPQHCGGLLLNTKKKVDKDFKRRIQDNRMQQNRYIQMVKKSNEYAGLCKISQDKSSPCGKGALLVVRLRCGIVS